MTYSALAPIYDRVMSHVRYTEWLTLIRKIIGRYAQSPRPTIFEIGAGTGVLGTLLKRSGYTYSGSDLSYDMCHVARSRGLTNFCADGRALPIRKTFDMVLFLYDGINYLESEKDYRQLFKSAGTLLKTGGLFLFDITTLANSRRYFADFYDSEDLGDSHYSRRSYFDESCGIQHNDFSIFHHDSSDPGKFVEFEEHHRQWVHGTGTIRGWIPTNLFTVVGIWNGYTFKPCTMQSTRIHFLLQKLS